MQFRVNHVSELVRVAEYIVQQLTNCRHVLLLGEMGVGKTTLVRAVGEVIGVKEHIASPTYALVHEYSYINSLGQEAYLHHLDLYKVKDLAELIEAGIEEIFYDSSVVLVEWPQLALQFLPNTYLVVQMEQIDENTRTVLVTLQNSENA
jgi:tRNA threonylcarbamoyladenosine biosynthesis protein TsaE